jgi:hypothetical protein
MSKQARDQAVARVGEKLYGVQWQGAPSDEDWAVSEAYGRPVDMPAQEAAATNIARACFRVHAADIQFRQVIHWLEQHGISCEAAKFDQAKFDAWFSATFKSLGPETRQAAARVLLDEGKIPGRRGTIQWKPFCDELRERWGYDCDDRTIQDDVRAIRKAIGK